MASFVPKGVECDVLAGHFQLALDLRDGDRLSAMWFVHGEPEMFSAVSACSFSAAEPPAPNPLSAYVPYRQPAAADGYAVGGVPGSGLAFNTFKCAAGVPPPHGGSPEEVVASDTDGESDDSRAHVMQQRTALDAHLPPARTFADFIAKAGWELAPMGSSWASIARRRRL
eukprot:gene21595-25974_t